MKQIWEKKKELGFRLASFDLLLNIKTGMLSRQLYIKGKFLKENLQS